MGRRSTAARRASVPWSARSVPARSRGRCCSDPFSARGRVVGCSSSVFLIDADLIYGTLALSPPLVVAIVAAITAGFAFGPSTPSSRQSHRRTRRRTCWNAFSGRSPRSHRRRSRSELWLRRRGAASGADPDHRRHRRASGRFTQSAVRAFVRRRTGSGRR